MSLGLSLSLALGAKSNEQVAIACTEGDDTLAAVLSPFGIDVSTQGDLSTGLVTLPSWLTIACATTGRTSQVSASAIKGGLGANAARCRSTDGSAKGLNVERAATNLCWQSKDLSGANWAVSGATPVVTVNVQNAPDGTLTADELDITTGNGLFQDFNTDNVPFVASIWGQLLTGGAASTINLTNPNTGVPSTAMALTAGWLRYSVSIGANNPQGLFLQKNSGTKIGVFSFAQMETGKYPTSAFPAASTNATRAADVLAVPAPANLAPGGYFDLDLTFAPNYSSADMGVDHDLVFFDSNNRVFVQQSTLKIVLRIGGADVLSSALTWSRETAIRVQAKHLSTGRSLTISGASTGNGAASGVAVSTFSLPATAYVLGNASGAEECADLRSLQVNTPP